MNRANNDIRDWLDEGGQRIPQLSRVLGISISRPQSCAKRWKAIAAYT
jgi:hypothetical protein